MLSFLPTPWWPFQPNQTSTSLHLLLGGFGLPGLTANNEAAQIGAFEANAMGTICRAMASELVRKLNSWIRGWIFFDPNGEQKHRVKTKKIWEHSTFSQKSKRLDGFGFFDSIEKYSRQSVKMEVVKTWVKSGVAWAVWIEVIEPEFWQRCLYGIWVPSFRFPNLWNTCVFLGMNLNPIHRKVSILLVQRMTCMEKYIDIRYIDTLQLLKWTSCELQDEPRKRLQTQKSLIFSTPSHWKGG